MLDRRPLRDGVSKSADRIRHTEKAAPGGRK